MLGLELPVFSELHLKASFEDRLGAVPRDLPLVVWDDPQRLAWTDEERAALGADPATAHLAGTLPAESASAAAGRVRGR